MALTLAPGCRSATWRWCSFIRPIAGGPYPHDRHGAGGGPRRPGGHLLDRPARASCSTRPARRARHPRHRLPRRRRPHPPGACVTEPASISMAISGRTMCAARVQEHGRALRRWASSRRRQGRGDPDRALHDGRRSSTSTAPEMPHSRGRRVSGSTGANRRQRRRQFDGVQACRRQHGGDPAPVQTARPQSDKAAIRGGMNTARLCAARLQRRGVSMRRRHIR